jgi:hypothetical protein
MRNQKGSASALIILVLTVLVLLGVLSLVTIAADKRLADKRADWIQEYYQIDAQAVRLHASFTQEVTELASANALADIISEDTAQWAAQWFEQSGAAEAHAALAENAVEVSYVVGDDPPGEAAQLLEVRLAVSIEDDNVQVEIRKWQQRQSERPEIDETGVVWVPD